jgi:hypothetical protein
MNGVQFPVEVRIFSCHHCIQIDYAPTHPLQWVLEALSLGIKWLGHEADHLHASSAKVKNA